MYILTLFISTLTLKAQCTFGLVMGSSGNICLNSCDANAFGTALSGTAPYTFTWTPINIISPLVTTTHSVTNLCPGQYTISVSDAMGCISTETLNIIPSSNPCVGINEIQAQFKVEIFPNPVINLIHLEDVSNNSEAFIVDLLGQIVLKTECIDTINVTSLSPGLYYLNILTNTNRIYFNKFIKQ